MSNCSSSVDKYIIVESSESQTFSGLTVCGGGGLTVDFITGCTSNDGVNVEGAIFSNGTLTIPTINATTFSGGTFYGDGSNLIGISTIDSYMTGGTYSNGFITFSGNGVFSDVSVDVSGLLDDTNSYVTGQTLNGTILETSRNGGLSTLTTDLLPILSGKTDNSTFNSYTSSTQSILDSKVDDSTFINYTGNTQNILNTKIDNGINVGGGHEIFSGITGTDMNFRTLSGGSNTTLTTFDGLVKIDVSIPSEYLTIGESDDRYVNITGDTLLGTLFLSSGTTTSPSLVINGPGDFLVSPQVGAFEFIGNSLYFTDGSGSRRNILLAQSGFTATTVNALQDTEVSGVLDGQTWYYDGTSNVWRNTSNITINDTSNVVTINDLFVTNGVTGATFHGDGSNLTNIDNFYVTGGTYSGGNLFFSGNSVGTTFSVDVNGLLDDTDTLVTGFTFNPTTYNLTLGQNNGVLNKIVDLSVLADDVYVLSGAYNISTGVVTYTNSSGGTFNVSGFTSGMTDTYTTDAYILSGETIAFNSNLNGTNYYNVDLGPLLSGKTNNSTFNSYTSSTQSILNTKIDGGINVGGGHEVFSGITGTDMNFRTLSGGSNTTLTTVGDVIKIDVSTHTVNTDNYVTGSTLVSGNTLVISRNNGLPDITTDLTTLNNPTRLIEQKLFLPAITSTDMGSSSLVYHGTTGVSFLAFGGVDGDNEQGAFSTLIPDDYVSGGTIELIYTTQTTANDVVWSFAITNCSNGIDFSTITESGPHLDIVSSGQTFLDMGTTIATIPTGTTFSGCDALTVKVNRDADDSRDTANNITAYIYGLIFRYNTTFDVLTNFELPISACDTSIDGGTTTVGSITTTDTFLTPVNALQGYSWSASIYEPSEIGAARQITQLEYSVNNDSSTLFDQTIILAHVSEDRFTGSTTIGLSELNVFDKVTGYTGTITMSQFSWDEITLTENFCYNGTDNLMVIWENRYGTGDVGAASFEYDTTLKSNAAYASDAAAYPTDIDISTTSTRPVIRFSH